jgi:hypothetical protein
MPVSFYYSKLFFKHILEFFIYLYSIYGMRAKSVYVILRILGSRRVISAGANLIWFEL